MLNIFLFIFLGTCGWGISLYLIKILLVSLTPIEIVLYRALIGAVSLFILAKCLKLRSGKLKDLLLDGLIVGIFNMTLPFYLTTLAERTVSSSLASIINGLTPLCTYLLSFFWLANQKTHYLKLASLFLGLLGIILINIDSLQSHGNMLDFLALLASCFSYGIAAHYLKKGVRTKEPLLVAAMAAACSSLIMLLFQLGTTPQLHWGRPSNLTQLGLLLWLGVIGTGLCLYLYSILIERIGAVSASLITYLMTVSGVFMGVVFLDEKMSRLEMIGCVFIVISLISMNHSKEIQRLFQFLFRSRLIAPPPFPSQE